MKDVATRFERFLRGRNLRLTRQRLAILSTIYGTHRHVSAEQLFDMVSRSTAGSSLAISRATVYRTLSLLEEGGFVERLDVGRDSGTLYEHTLGHEHHDHMICFECGRIYEFHDDQLEAVQARAVAAHGFVAKSHRLNVFGTCARCLGKRAGAGADAAGG